MYAPSRHDGREPCITSHSVGGSSLTGAKLPESTRLGSNAGRRGGSIKLLIMSSNVSNILSDGIGVEFGILVLGGLFVGVAVVEV